MFNKNLQSMGKILAALGIILAIFFTFSASLPSDAIPWNSQRKLSWSDFKTLVKAPHNGALTTSVITYEYHCNNNTIQFKVNAWFIPDQSWVKSTMKNDYILAHEQLHFDITELHARILRKRLTEEVKTCKDASKSEKIYRETVNQLDKMQDEYDLKTSNSMEKTNQIIWQDSVYSRLKALKNWELK